MGMRTHLRKGLICLAKSTPYIYEVSKSGPAASARSIARFESFNEAAA